MQEAGCTVIYGPHNFKVHSKLLLITRKIGNTVEYITQIGTGNYNEKTSTLYTDLSLMTANRDIGNDARNVFNALSLGNFVEHSEYLLVAPLCLQNRIVEMIDEEIRIAKSGQPAYVGAKINSLSDKVIIDKLIEASQAGVKIELIVRGICCLIAGVEGYTENISVTSIVGRYLEHSRIYMFGTKKRRKMYISSADYILLVLHFKHDGNEFDPVTALPENKVSLAAGSRVVVLLERRILKSDHADLVELVQAILLQTFPHHFGGKLCLELPVKINLALFVLQLHFVSFIQFRNFKILSVNGGLLLQFAVLFFRLHLGQLLLHCPY